MRRSNKSIVIFGFVALAFAPRYGEAHPPDRVKVIAQDKTLTVEVMHTVEPTVSDPQQHYIDRIIVSVNGAFMIDQRFSKQEGNTQAGVYAIPSLKQGDVVQAEAFCRQYGSGKGETVVGGKRSY